MSKSYHGRVFEGGACRKLQLKSGHLASHEYLEDVENKNQVIAISNTLQAMNRLVDACFCNDLKGNVGILLDEFALLYKSLNMTTTLKVHVLMEHLIPNLANLGGKGMGLTSEQVGEAIHHKFENYWARYKIESLDNENHSSNWV